jgi:hypothetical protein
LVAEGSAAGSNAGLVGALVGAGLAATVGIVNARMDYNQAVDGAQAAFDQEMQSLSIRNWYSNGTQLQLKLRPKVTIRRK